MLLALAATLDYFITMLAFPLLVRRLPRSKKLPTEIQVSYQDGRGLLRTILVRCTDLPFSIDRVGLEQSQGTGPSMVERMGFGPDEDHEIAPTKGDVTLTTLVRGKRPISHLVAAIGDIDGVQEVWRVDRGVEFE